MSEFIAKLLDELRQWDGDDVYDVKVVLEKLLAADPENAESWIAPAREFLNSVNQDMWLPDLSDEMDWWAIDVAMRRLYTSRGKMNFATAAYPQRRSGGTI